MKTIYKAGGFPRLAGISLRSFLFLQRSPFWCGSVPGLSVAEANREPAAPHVRGDGLGLRLVEALRADHRIAEEPGDFGRLDTLAGLTAKLLPHGLSNRV